VSEHEVVIAGGGPTGLMLAGELALAGIDVAIAERRANHDLHWSGAGGLHSRTIEVLDQRGIADRFLSEGQPMQVQTFARVPLDISDFPTRHNYGLALWQKDFERILAAWVEELGTPILREREVTGFAQDDAGVDVEISDGEPLRAHYLVGCDGGRSVVRRAAGIEFPGWEPSVSSLIAEAKLAEEPEWEVIGGQPGLLLHDDNGTQALGRLEDGRVRMVLSERYTGQTEEPTLHDLSEGLAAVWGMDYGVHDPAWISRFTDRSRQAASYREGRVLLAGDAAHIHYPIGGQGLNIGVQDAVNLGWKLAQVVEGTSSEELLDSYQTERHPVAARVLQNTMAQTALIRADPRIGAARDIVAELATLDEPRRWLAGMISGLDIHYDLGDGHPLLGRRMPDLDVGSGRVYELLHEARPLLVNFGAPGSLNPELPDRVELVDADYDGVWELPVIGRVPPPTAVLVRPDGHVAWVGEESNAGLLDALGLWFGRHA
jgi:2-polyprenyl-6-methoxyphenol hydroxylase-like FAD-dependent oxidoreductase